MLRLSHTGRQDIWLPLFSGSVYHTLFLLDCFDVAYVCIFSHKCVYSVTCLYSVTVFIVVINNTKALHWAFAVLWSFPLFFNLKF